MWVSWKSRYSFETFRLTILKTLVRKYSTPVCDYYSHIVFVINIAAIHSIKKDMYERFQVKVHEWKIVDKPIRTSTFFEMLLTFKMHKCIPLHWKKSVIGPICLWYMLTLEFLFIYTNSLQEHFNISHFNLQLSIRWNV